MDLHKRIENGETPISPYVYEIPEKCDPDLCQGDVINVTGELREKFKKFYPSIEHPDGVASYAMVLTQSCDLVRRKLDAKDSECQLPSAPHILLCLVRPIERSLAYEMAHLGRTSEAGHFLLQKTSFDSLRLQVSRLINNSESKNLFFLPAYTEKFLKHSVAILSLGYAFRRQHYDDIFKNRILSLKSEFRAKIGNLLSEYYGRVATCDLFEEYGEKGLLMLATNILKSAKILDVNSAEAIEAVKSAKPTCLEDIERVATQVRMTEMLEQGKERKRKAIGFLNQKLFELIRNAEKMNGFAQMEEGVLRKELTSELQKMSEGLENRLL